MVLTQEEIDGCREAFLAFDKDRSGTIDVWEVRLAKCLLVKCGLLYVTTPFWFVRIIPLRAYAAWMR